ncbi:5-formyltetrahydrofolate cyclo-ligase [Spizellomyces punctatus DAOM BR117]|uniref:5-formyltetrahydrofolate cyclo-ligase n=1 Tax=Spizellomyces punctatus (strain DAOM BR117) TaxID=645134 RepID=A0A0L0HJ85_SPIPD|nr:5-formyltetrahydrofolate cyclo-ligase [Spizellomyces punctatus DAOM BR117]KND00899.1 5-formyltetrahydrofolate cyclo-ligase [Spizellomyces punctatus DAOM BR117]|eukprot:XP_016608938.1 5-formyltetrahydrofolate cyclo-ligase [Spizellomyces punctatus DAOM BR117]
MDHATIRALKNALRKDMRKRLAQVPADIVRKESNIVIQKLFAMKEYQQSRNISVYISMPSGEVSTTEIIRDLFDKGKKCFIPRCDGNVMEMVRLVSWDDYKALPTNKWNIPEPLLDEARENALQSEGLDLVIVPGLAFDGEGWRMGHGKGYYDRYLRKVADWSASAGKPPPITVALALSEQVIESPVPRESFDQKPHYVITPTGVIE